MKVFFIALVVTVTSTLASADLHCDVKKFGARGDGKTKDTVAIQAAIDSCAQNGGQVDTPAPRPLSTGCHRLYKPLIQSKLPFS